MAGSNAAVKLVSENPSPIKRRGKEPDWTREDIARMAKTPQTVLDALVTPRLAKLLLEFNTENRPHREKRVSHFAELLRAGRWINTGEPVIISREGPLNEGQHRLQGIVEAGIPAMLDIRFGVPREAFVVTGTGATRTAGDVLAIAGYTDQNALAAVAKLSLGYQQGLPGSYRWYLNSDLILGAVKRWPDMPDSLKKMKQVLHAIHFTNAASGTFAFLAFRQGSPNRVRDFLHIIQTGEAPAKDAARMLRERLLNDAELRWGGREIMVEKLALFITAWNYWKQNSRPSRINWRKSDPYPVMERVKL